MKQNKRKHFVVCFYSQIKCPSKSLLSFIYWFFSHSWLTLLPSCGFCRTWQSLLTALNHILSVIQLNNVRNVTSVMLHVPIKCFSAKNKQPGLTLIDFLWNSLTLCELNMRNFQKTERAKTPISDLFHSSWHKAASDLHNIMIILHWDIFRNKHEHRQGWDGNLGVLVLYLVRSCSVQGFEGLMW